MAIENVRHPIKDTVKADNSTYSSNKIESLIHSATELPETSVADAGDVLMVNDEGEWDKGEIIIPQEVPTPTSENIGKVVTVVSDGDEGAEYGLTNLPDSDIFYFDVRLLQASTSSVPEGHDVALMGMTGTSFDDAKSALDAGKRVVARITIFDQIPTDISFTWASRDFKIKKGDIHFMDFGGYIQEKKGTPMYYRGHFPPYDYSTQGADGFRMSLFTPDNGTGINRQVNVFLDH